MATIFRGLIWCRILVFTGLSSMAVSGCATNRTRSEDIPSGKPLYAGWQPEIDRRECPATFEIKIYNQEPKITRIEGVEFVAVVGKKHRLREGYHRYEVDLIVFPERAFEFKKGVQFKITVKDGNGESALENTDFNVYKTQPALPNCFNTIELKNGLPPHGFCSVTYGTRMWDREPEGNRRRIIIVNFANKVCGSLNLFLEQPLGKVKKEGPNKPASSLEQQQDDDDDNYDDDDDGGGKR